GDFLAPAPGHYGQLDGARPELLDGGIAACIWYPSRQFTQYAVYDVSDRANPVQTRVFEIEGNPLSTRMIGTDLYFVSSRYIYAVPLDDMGEGDILPLYRDTAEKEAYQVVAPEEIYYFPDSQESNYLLVGAFDVTGNEPARIDSYLGAGSTIYMNLNSLYVARMNWSEGKNQTHFYRFTVERSSEDAPPAVHYAAEGAVPGYLLNQYSMDEYNGVFRAALTDWNVGNYIYTFDTADMQGLGRTEPLAHDEQIRSARFMGDMAYMVTFRQTDPLFTIDLSDPRNPVVLGELKIPGFSSYLHPLGDGLMIGFGRNVLETYVDLPGGGREVVGTIDMGAKISLFDLSDPANPLEIDVLNLERNTWSSDFDNPRAIMVDRERQIFGFSVADYGSINPADVFTGRLIGVQDRRLVDLATLKDADSRKDGGDKDDYYHYYKGERRLRYIGGTLYHISGADVTAFDYTTFERLGTLAFSE
ncbi:MAG: beta-propeller domain-containing protein, partial [Oscillospiraceae bacterium]|nr:beta-propeller domain-containing protein [Oscillospiraceae bacterium]